MKARSTLQSPAGRWYAPDTADIRPATEIRPLSAPVGRWEASHHEKQRSGQRGSREGSCEARGRSPTMNYASTRHSDRQRSPVRRMGRVCVSHRTKASPAQLAPCAGNTAANDKVQRAYNTQGRRVKSGGPKTRFPQSSRLSCRRPAGWSEYAGAAQWDGPVAGKSTTGVYLAHPSRDWPDAMGVSRSRTPRPPPSKKRFHPQSFFERSECPGGAAATSVGILSYSYHDASAKCSD